MQNSLIIIQKCLVNQKISNCHLHKCLDMITGIMVTLIVLHHIFINTISLEDLNKNNYLKLINWNYILLKIISNYGQFGNNV